MFWGRVHVCLACDMRAKKRVHLIGVILGWVVLCYLVGLW